MANDSARALRLLELYLIFAQETDREHPLTIHQLLERLEELDLGCNPKTLFADFKLLDRLKIRLGKVRVGHQMAYYGPGGMFSAGELKILFDAVQGCCFIPEKETKRLIHKIAVQSGCLDASGMENSIIRFNNRKHTNHEIFRTVEQCSRAIHAKKQLSFRYFHLNFSGEPVYAYLEAITVDPLALVFYEDWFYLIAYVPFRGDIRHYRLDRMENTAALETDRSEEAKPFETDVAAYTTSIFKMFDGEEELVTLEFDALALAPVFDKFGENIKLQQIDRNQARLTQKIAVSDVFFGWVDQFRGHLRITAPESVKEQYREHLEDLLKAVSQ